MTTLIEKIANAELDLQTVAEVSMVNYTGDTTTNRNGDVINTLVGQLKSLGYIPPVAYAASIAFTATDHTKTFERNGIVYAPLPSALPFTTSGTWTASDETKVFVIQVGSVATLGASEVTYSNVGLTATTAEEALDELVDMHDDQQDDIGNLVTLSGVAADATTMGAFTGTTIPDGSDIKECLQALETKVESVDVTSRGTTITVTVGTGGDYLTINAAIAYLSGLYPKYVKGGFTATVSFVSGFTMAEQVIVRAIDLSWITITGTESSYTLTRSALTTKVEDECYPAFAAIEGGKLPKINAELIMDTTGTATDRYGVYVSGAGSSATITASNGVRNAAGYSIYATNGAVVSAASCLVSGSSVGIGAHYGATVYANNAVANNCSVYGIVAMGASTISATSANVSSCGIGVFSDSSSRIDFTGGDATTCTTNGVYAQNLGQITAQYAECRKVGGSNTASDIIVLTGGIISAHSAVGGTTPATKNAITTAGIIFG